MTTPGQATHAVDVETLEVHLRGQIAVLVGAGLATDEAFLVAVKRVGDHRFDRLSAAVRVRLTTCLARAVRREPIMIDRGRRNIKNTK